MYSVRSAVKILGEISGANVFTGIIEEIGLIQDLRFMPLGATITVGAGLVASDLKIGDSISVNGVCLTATRVGAGFFVCDISAETLRISNFKHAKQGSRINLERSLRIGDRLGGHFVQGDVDGIGRLISKNESGEGFEMSFDFPRELERYLVYKGSVAVNGISLTISSLSKGIFSVAVIPLTFESTNLNQLIIGDLVNLEVDILGKYFERFFQLGLKQSEGSSTRITSEYMKIRATEMGTSLNRLCCAILIFGAVVSLAFCAAEVQLPAFGQDTVLVWKSENQGYIEEFVVRIAEFSPDRFLEWEDSKTQGTIFIPNRDILSARGLVSSALFESGMDTRAKDATTLWLSQKIYHELKEKKKAKCDLDGVLAALTYRGEDQITVEVNRSSMVLRAIKVSDDRGSEKWFLDREENPLMLKYTVRQYTQVLTSITTDRPNTLRWIKGKKLDNLPH